MIEKFAVPPASVVINPAIGVTVIPAVSSFWIRPIAVEVLI
jgi:hypothetical protein